MHAYRYRLFEYKLATVTVRIKCGALLSVIPILPDRVDVLVVDAV